MRTASRLFTLVIVCCLFSGLAPATTQAQETPPMVDLPAAALTPADAEALGVSGLGRFQNGHYRTLDEYVQIRSDFLNIPLAEVESAMSGAGYLQGYTSNLGIPQDPGNPDSPPSRVVFSSLYEFGTEEGASSAFAFNTSQYGGVTIATVDTSIAPSAPVGDEQIMTRTTSATMEEEGPSDQVDTVFRVGTIVASTGVVDYGMTVESVEDPAPADPEIVALVEQLAARLFERIELAQDGSVPDLSGKALTLFSEGADPAFTSEGYRRLEGEDIPYYNGYQDDFPEIATADMTAVYEVGQGLGSPSGDPFDPYFGSRIFAFSSEDAASAFLEGFTGPPGTESEIVPDGAATLGQEAKLIQYDLEIGPDLVAQGYQVVQRSGSLVTMMILESADHRPDVQVVLDLARQQASCLAEGCEHQQLPMNW
jgi:hypothetical protein